MALTAAQLRAARGLLRVSQKDLSELAGVSVETVKRLEAMDGPLTTTRVATVEALTSALESAGVEFIPENGGGPGVRLGGKLAGQRRGAFRQRPTTRRATPL